MLKPALRPYLFIAAFHFVGLVLLSLSGSIDLAVGAVAWVLGMRHAFDADHVVAIDNASRSIIARGKSAHAVGFHFSLGHSVVVLVATVALVVIVPVWGFGTAVHGPEIGALQTTAAVIAAAASGGFLLLIGTLNLRVLIRIIRDRRRSGGPDAGEGQTATSGPQIARAPIAEFLVRHSLRLDRPHRLILVGMLFGLGLDTALSVLTLVVGGTSAHPAAVIWLAFALPMLFLAGMSLGDTVNSQLMNRAYRWASGNQGRRSICNLVITAVSALAAVGLGVALLAGAGAGVAGLVVIYVLGVTGLGAAVAASVQVARAHRLLFRRQRCRPIAMALAATLLVFTGCSPLPTASSAVTSTPSAFALHSDTAAPPEATAPTSSDAAGSSTLTVESPTFVDGGSLPVEYTCDGAATSPPLEWSGAPAGTVGYAVIMHHVPSDGVAHWYWVLYRMAVSVNHLQAGATPPASVGTNSVNRNLAYAPPCSKGPGLKNYIFTVYALSAQPTITAGTAVSRNLLLTAIKGHVLAEKSLTVTYSRIGVTP